MKYDFDKVIDRRGTDTVKYDLLEPLFGRKDLIPLWVADMDFEVPPVIREAIVRRAEHGIYGYTVRSSGFYASVAEWLERRHGWKVDTGKIDFSPGIVPALVLSVLGFTEPGDRIIVQSPVYFPFFSSIENQGRILVNNRLVDTGGYFTIDFDDLEQKFREGAKMMMFCSPHNPVGRAWKRDELEQLAALAVKYGVLILSDEIHSDLLLYGNRHIPLASLGEEIAAQTITCIAPSKTFNLAGLHTSVIIAENPVLKKKYVKILDHIHVGGGNLFGFIALEAAYREGEEWLGQLLSYLEGNFTLLRDTLQERAPGIRVSALEATYLSWLNFEKYGMSDRELMKLMVEQAKLAFVDGPRFGAGGEQYLRMNIALPRSLMMESVERICRAIEKHSPEKA